MTNDVNINVPRLDLKTKTNPVGGQIIVPGSNQLQIDCIGCKGREFHISVKPKNDGSAQITEIVCFNCNKLFQVNPENSSIGGFQSVREVK